MFECAVERAFGFISILTATALGFISGQSVDIATFFDYW